ncbi:MAG: LPXTG cell wall anchor domain-containing protein [Methanoregula sp.]
MFSFERFNDNNRTPVRKGIKKTVFTYGGITHKIGNRSARILLIAGTLLAICLFVGTASAIATTESMAVSAKVYVSNVTYDPGSFYDGDKAIVDIQVTNGNTDTGIVINHAQLSDDTIRIVSRPYDTSSNIGPGQTRDYIFEVTADGKEGYYYPTFSLSFLESDSLYYRTFVEIDNSLPELTFIEKPDTFSAGKKDKIYAKISNPRSNAVENVIVDITGTGTTINPSEIFIGTINAGGNVLVNFSVTPQQQTDLTLKVTYDNGDNTHTMSESLPLIFGENKKQADPKVNNIKITKVGTVYHVTGDVTNAGLETANAVTITSGSPATAQDPYKNYVVGVLKPDDFGSFEVSFSTESTTSIPLQMSYKDTDGNVITSQQNINLATATSSDTNTAQPSILPIIGVIIVIALVGGGYLYLRKRKAE